MVWSYHWFLLLSLSLHGHHCIFIGHRRRQFASIEERLPAQFEARSSGTTRSNPILQQQTAESNVNRTVADRSSDSAEDFNSTASILSDNLDLDLSANVIVSSLAMAEPSPSDTSYNLEAATSTLKYKTQQHFEGIPIFGASLVIEENIHSLRRRPIFGHWYDPKDIAQHIPDTTPSIANASAIDIALDALSITEHDLFAPITAKLWIYYVDSTPTLSWILRPIDYGLDASAMVVVDAITEDARSVYNDTLSVHHSHHHRSHVEACGVGGNTKIGRFEYCTPISEDESDWILKNDRVIVYDNNGEDNDPEDLNDAEPVECSMDSDQSTKCEIEDDAVNGAYCPVSHCLTANVFYVLSECDWLEWSQCTVF